jgi:hypothetical protein
MNEKFNDGKNFLIISTDTKSAIYYHNEHPIDMKLIQFLNDKYKFHSLCFSIPTDYKDFFSSIKLSSLSSKINNITICPEDDVSIYFSPNRLISCDKQTQNNIIKICDLNIDSFDFLSKHNRSLLICNDFDKKLIIFPTNINSPFNKLYNLKLSGVIFQSTNLNMLANSRLKLLELSNLDGLHILKYLPSSLKELWLRNVSNLEHLLQDLSYTNLETIHIINTSNCKFPEILNNLPVSLQYLHLKNLIFCKGQIKSIPVNLKTLYLENCYGYHNFSSIIPKNLKNLYYDLNFSRRHLPKLPRSNLSLYEKLKIINKDRKKLIKNLPSSLQRIKFDNEFFSQNGIKLKSFDYLINCFPTSLSDIHFGHSFNEPIDNLPSNIKYLVLGDSFNQPIDNLPSSIEFLDLGNSFDKRIDNLPSSIETLVLGDSFNQPIDNLPSRMKYLYLGESFNKLIDNLPVSLVELIIKKDSIFNQPISRLPNNLRTLKILSYEFNQPISRLPNKITELELGSSFNHPIELSSKIKKITIHNSEYTHSRSVK